jgi:hypothetical protein
MTTNIELELMAKQLNIPNFHCCMCDELKSIKNPLNIICNLQSSDHNGSHWVLIHNGEEKIYYCPFGSNIPKEIQEFLSKPILSSDIQIQPFDSDECGLYLHTNFIFT